MPTVNLNKGQKTFLQTKAHGLAPGPPRKMNSPGMYIDSRYKQLAIVFLLKEHSAISQTEGTFLLFWLAFLNVLGLVLESRPVRFSAMATAPGTGYRFLPTPYGTNSSYPHKLSYS